METSEPPERGAEDAGQSPEATEHAGQSPAAAEQVDDVGRNRRRAFHEVIHLWIPLSIVVVSVLAAVMGWRASVADETATRKYELSRQDLVQQQQLLIEDNDAVDNDIRAYGEFAQYSGLAHSLLHDAGQVGGTGGAVLQSEGQADLGIAQYLGKQIKYLNYGFDPSSPTGNSYLRSDGTLLPGNAYNAQLAFSVAQNTDVDLHGLAPDQLLAQAESAHTQGVRLTGIAALFIAVMVLLTVAALITGPPKVWLVGSGATIMIAALVLFVLVEAS
ncbi:MAG TPA: hypothetical protein VG410_04065 [Solirubrobacteraceae bacterium]|jgi:hypothetical protein|nr:hypothetical protein [Solirubrobacteraceae bacterium]